MSTGIALVIYVRGEFASLLAVLVVAVTGAVIVSALALQSMEKHARTAVAARAKVGLVAGFAATAGYDLVRWVLVAPLLHLDPYAALPTFGRALAGADVEVSSAYVLGFAYHVLNGLAFATSYAVLMPRGGILSGIAWGMGLELAMLTIYPGWLHINAVREFTVLSVTGHLVYGATLGLLVPRLLARRGRLARAHLTDA